MNGQPRGRVRTSPSQRTRYEGSCRYIYSVCTVYVAPPTVVSGVVVFLPACKCFHVFFGSKCCENTLWCCVLGENWFWCSRVPRLVLVLFPRRGRVLVLNSHLGTLALARARFLTTLCLALDESTRGAAAGAGSGAVVRTAAEAAV
jgi:hypothetical protein